MNEEQREITLHTPNKIYTGFVDVGAKAMRTIDIFNSANMYWKNPAERSFDDALLLHRAKISLDGGVKIGEFSKVQIRLVDIILFIDSLGQTGCQTEKVRAAALKQKTKEETSTVQILTRAWGGSFYYIRGTFYGLFKSKSSKRYVPITQANVQKITRTGEKWQKSELVIDNAFVGVSTSHIEACAFGAKSEPDQPAT
ncbi:hypothetical protein [Desulforhopalus singaporensis]|uniref:Uncharacterized protein n=1 Tax=Desulforhopalus singaporensis TaxID=91360 RepID=A0A1H0LWG1_9BACT|nr:hypothetical protein [Desulforhopalus singaporensis]SDO72552.1 hypothetical protein SAMN05660330_00884 [Desulforhopalus singaporensis]